MKKYYNLISNALKFTGKGKSIDIILQSLYAEPIPKYEIHVKDMGTGISEEKLSYIFERFYKAYNADMNSSHGTGIGLAIEY